MYEMLPATSQKGEHERLLSYFFLNDQNPLHTKDLNMLNFLDGRYQNALQVISQGIENSEEKVTCGSVEQSITE